MIFLPTILRDFHLPNRFERYLSKINRGQGLSEKAGSYMMDDFTQARKAGGAKAAEAKMLHLLTSEQLQDQLAAKNKIAVAGNSFGGIETVLASDQSYCAEIGSQQ